VSPTKLVQDTEVTREVIELSIRMGEILKAVERLEESNEGTLRTRGLKERIVLAEQDIKQNKDSFDKVDRHITEVETKFHTALREAFTETNNNFNKKFDTLNLESQAQKTFIGKIQPWVNGIAWLVAVVGPIVIGLLITGAWRVGPP
jgi:chromosome segregation ATPase